MLTVREQDTLNYIIEFKKVNGYAPTIREICTGINTKSKPHVHAMLESLQDKNYIQYEPGKHRNIKVLKFKNHI